MTKYFFNLVLAIVMLGYASVVCAEDKPAEAPPKAANEVTLEKLIVCPPATLDFRGGLGLDFAGLMDLGVRIETALDRGDPVTLAACGLELKAAEAASGKFADLTSEELLERAFEMVILTGNVQEIKALKVLMPEKEMELGKAEELIDNDEEARGFRHLQVTNYTTEPVFVFINHRRVGEIPAARSQAPKESETISPEGAEGEIAKPQTQPVRELFKGCGVPMLPTLIELKSPKGNLKYRGLILDEHDTYDVIVR